MMTLYFFLGILIGSFLNVCIYRLPKKEEVVFTPSHCTYCNTPLRWVDLIPLFSYLFLGGKCRYCKNKISIQYPLIELLNGAAYMGIFALYGASLQTVILSALFSILLVLSVIDIKYLLIPNGLILAIMVLGLLQIGLDPRNWFSYLLGFFAASSLLLLISIITRGKMGGGDIKLMATAGLLLGWQKIILALFIGSFFGAVLGLVLMGFKVIERKQMIPFGPFLSLGILIAALFSEPIINFYLHLFI